jgi:hypothetical protein
VSFTKDKNGYWRMRLRVEGRTYEKSLGTTRRPRAHQAPLLEARFREEISAGSAEAEGGLTFENLAATLRGAARGDSGRMTRSLSGPAPHRPIETMAETDQQTSAADHPFGNGAAKG